MLEACSSIEQVKTCKAPADITQVQSSLGLLSFCQRLAEGLFILDTDASDFAVGGVLSQLQNVIAYASSCISKPERKHRMTRNEIIRCK